MGRLSENYLAEKPYPKIRLTLTGKVEHNSQIRCKLYGKVEGKLTYSYVFGQSVGDEND